MKHGRHISGFTLVELVVSAVLTSMMMTAIISVVWSTMKQTEQLQREELRSASPVELTRQMRTDFLNARGMEVNENGVTLHGFVARDPSDKSISLGRGRVRYALREANGRRLLARTSDAKTWEPLWVGFGDLSIEPLSQTEADSDEMPLAETGNLAQIPESFRITLRSDDGSILWKEIIHHHEN